MSYLKKGETTLPVLSLYPYRYDFGKGKSVIRVKCEGSVGFDTIQSFFAQVADYDYYEGEDGSEVFMNTYTQYGMDVDIHYVSNSPKTNEDGTVTPSTSYYSVEVARNTTIETTVIAIQQDISNLTTQLSTLEDQTSTLETNVADSENELTATQLALVEQYEANIVLEEELETTKTDLATTMDSLNTALGELTAAQVALVELYESIIAIEEEMTTPTVDDTEASTPETETPTEETVEPTEPTTEDTSSTGTEETPVEDTTETTETV